MRARMILPIHQPQAYARSLQTARIGLYPSFSDFAFASALRLLPYGLSVMRRPIGKALPDDTTDRTFSALYIITAERNAIAVAEIEFRQVPMQVLLFAVLVHAFHAALKNREVAFNGIGVNDALDAMPHVFVD